MARKSTAVKAKANGPIDKATVDRVVKMRSQGKSWDEILKTEKQGSGFVHSVRQAMKQRDPALVRKSYDRGTVKKTTAKKAGAVSSKSGAGSPSNAKGASANARKTAARRKAAAKTPAA